MTDQSQVLWRRPWLIPFAVLSAGKDWLLQPNRTLQGSDQPVGPSPGQWSTARRFPSWRYEFGAAVLKDEIYVVGGLTMPTVYTVTRRMEVYSPDRDAWRQAASYPVIIHHPGVATAGERLYVVGGNGLRITPYSYVFEYDSDENHWRRKADMPTPRGALGMTELDGLIYAVGGGTNKVPRVELEVYDPHRDVWARLAPMPTPREHLAAAAAGGLVFALGGYRKSLSECLTTNEAYNPSTGQWETRAPMPLAISGFAAVGIENSVFIFGGEQGWAVSGECHEYKVAEDRWMRRADMPMPRYACAAVPVNGRIHVIGGSPRLRGYMLSMGHHVFTP